MPMAMLRGIAAKNSFVYFLWKIITLLLFYQIFVCTCTAMKSLT
jgi:hypothetical protein